MTDVKDFDEAFAEMAGEPIRFRLFGREWSVGRGVPATAMLQVARLQQRMAEDTVSPADLIDSAKAFLDPVMVEEWIELGIEADQLQSILEHVSERRRGGGEGEAQPAPEAAPESSSSAGL